MGTDEKFNIVLEQYSLEIKQMYKFGGALYLETEQGFFMLRQRQVKEGRAVFEEEVKEHIYRGGFTAIDLGVKNNNGHYVTEGNYGETYTLRQWPVGEECDLTDEQSVLAGAVCLGRLHRKMSGYSPSPVRKKKEKAAGRESGFGTENDPESGKGVENENSENKKTENMGERCNEEEYEYVERRIPYIMPSVTDKFKRRTGEMKRIMTYLRKQRQKNEFEMWMEKQLPFYVEQAYKASAYLNQEYDEALFNEALKGGIVCHGGYSGHNIIINKETVSVVNFDKAKIGPRVFDLYHFIRKTGEKNLWSIPVITHVLDSYDREKPLDEREYNLLTAELIFPEKFWKVVNMYYNGKKSWIPGKIEEKLTAVCAAQEDKEKLLRVLERGR